MPVASAISYSVISIAITLINKAVLTSYCSFKMPCFLLFTLPSGFFFSLTWPFPRVLLPFFPFNPVPSPPAFESTMTLTLLQGLVTVICLEGMRRSGYIEYNPWSWDLVKKVSPLSFVFIAYVVISLVSLSRVNVPMFTALRRLTILFVMGEEFVLLGISPSHRVLYTVLVMFVGAAIAAWKDLTYDPVSYFYLFLTNLFTSLYTVYINVVRKDTGLNVFAMMYYNNITTMPFLLVLAWYTGDLGRAAAFTHYGEWFFQFNFQASIFLAFLLNLSTFYCTSLNTARTQTVVGQLKNFLAFLLGLLLFDDYIYDPINFVGLWIGFAGSVWYAFVTAEEKSAPKAGEDSSKAQIKFTPGAGTPGRVGGLPTIVEEEDDTEKGDKGEDLRVRQRTQ